MVASHGNHMTLVAALKSLDRIVVMSDTMISDEGSHHPNNSIPGRLKSIVLNRWFTVSYAGLAIQAMDAIRRIAESRDIATDGVVSQLQETSRQFRGEIDFLICSHEDLSNPRLVRVCAAQVSEGQDLYWIGNANSAALLARLELPPLPGESGGEYFSIEESRFTRRFHDYVAQGTDSHVGGVVINCLASPFGHCYQDHIGVRVDEVTIPDPLPPNIRQQLNQAGMNGYYSYAVLTSPERGDALVGIYFEQAGTGYIHQPLKRDDPEKVRASSQTEFQRLIRERSKR
jgi:hypothetical protein